LAPLVAGVDPPAQDLVPGRAHVPGTEARVDLGTGAAVGPVPDPGLVPGPSLARGLSPRESVGGGLGAAPSQRRDRKRDALVLAASLLSMEPPRLGKMSRPLAAGPGAVPPRKSVPVPSHQTRGRVVLQLRMRR
jgi:hypothetical protein